MRTISYKLDDLKKAIIRIGYVGENQHTQVRIDCSDLFKEYPDAAVSAAIVSPAGQSYPKVVTVDGSTVVWDVTDSDLAAEGDGEIQLTFTEGGVVAKTAVARFNVYRSIAAEGPAPDPVDDWLQEASEALEDIEAAEVNQPIIGQDGYWYKWNQEAGEYQKTNTKAQGEDGQPGHTPEKGVDYWTAADKAEMKSDVAGAIIDDTSTALDKTWSASKSNTLLSDLTSINRRFNNDTMLDNYALSALNKGRNVSPIVSFIDDDNNKQFSTFWLPIIEAKEIPVSMAVIVSQVGVGNSGTWDDIKNYHDNYGVEILSHSYYHKINAEDFDNLTVDEISENDFGLAKRILEEHGYEADLLVYPGSATDNKKVRIAVTRDYIGGIDGGDELNTTPISHYSIKRYHYAYDDGQTPDIDVLKGYVDACVAQNAWLIFESHSQYSSMTPETAAVICDLVDYIRSVGAEIVSAKEGFARFANIVDVEDGETRIGKFKLSPDGIVFNDTGINGGYSSSQIHNFYSGISSYKDYAVTKERIITDALLFPHNDSGILETIRYADNMVQYFMPFHYQEMWVREVTNNALPAEFTCLNETSGAYDNRNSLAGERKGNIYFDETNNRPIFCKTAGKRSVDQFTVTHGATSAGNIKISYAFGSKDIAVEAGDSAEEVASKIASASFIGHNIKQCLENPLVLYLTRILTGSTSGASFTDTDSTGVTISVSRVVTGSASAWVDASGNAVT